MSADPAKQIPNNQTLIRTLLITLLATGLAFAGEAEPTTAKAITELSAAYAKQRGHIATYRSVGEGKLLECTLGSDMGTGLAVIHLAMVSGNEKTETKFWCTSNDCTFMEDSGQLIVFRGISEEMKSLDDLEKVLGDRSAAVEGRHVQFTPGMLLTKSGVSGGLGFDSVLKPSWVGKVEDSTIQASDDKSVTFLTKEYGQLTISRENGMLIRQSVTREKGDVRVFELKDLQPNPGKEALTLLSAGWSTAGAQELPVVAKMAPLRLLSFQRIIDSAERGKVAKDKLDERLAEQYESLRHFAKACIIESEGSFASKIDWPSLFTKVKDSARAQWQAETPEGVMADDKNFLEFLQEPKVRLELRNKTVDEMLNVETLSKSIMDDIFGRGGWASLKVGNDRGVAAKKSLVEALSRAYLEALIDLKMTKQWDQRDGLD